MLAAVFVGATSGHIVGALAALIVVKFIILPMLIVEQPPVQPPAVANPTSKPKTAAKPKSDMTKKSTGKKTDVEF
jgi:hypothetical protein